MTSASGKITALLIGGTGATGKEVLKELNANDLVSKIIFISRRALEFPDQPKVRIHFPSLMVGLLSIKICLHNPLN